MQEKTDRKHMKKIGFYGLGLIGGSLAKAIKEIYPDTVLLATSGHVETIKEAYRAGVIVNDTLLPPEEFRGCELFILSAPVGKNIAYLPALAAATGDETLITDVGSVKGSIHEAARRLSLSNRFVGGHPMTGSERTGFGSARAELLRGAYYLLTPETEVPEERLDELKELLASLGSIPLLIRPEEHDRATAAVSHLPHVIAATLVNLVQKTDNAEGLQRRIAAGGFRDLTRIASSSPEMWESICIENREQLLSLIDLYLRDLTEVRDKIERRDPEEIRKVFAEAKRYRDAALEEN